MRWMLDGCCLALWQKLEQRQKGKVKLMRVVMGGRHRAEADGPVQLSQMPLDAPPLKMIGLEVSCVDGSEFGPEVCGGGTTADAGIVELDEESVMFDQDD